MSGNTVLALVLAIFGSTGFWTLINNIVQNKREKKSAQTQMLLGLAHDRIYELCHEYISRGYITAEEHDNLEHLYVPYVRMGGNGTGKILKEQVDKLPIKSSEVE